LPDTAIRHLGFSTRFTSFERDAMTGHLEIWRVVTMCGLWILAIALFLNGAEGVWLWVAVGAAVFASALQKARRDGGDGGGDSWYGDGDGGD
jgi:hypothetical protein